MKRDRSPVFVTVLCVAGLLVAGAGIAYCISWGGRADDKSPAAQTVAASSATGTSSDPSVDAVGINTLPTHGVTKRSQMILGTIKQVDQLGIVVSMADGSTRLANLDGQTQIKSPQGGTVGALQQGETVVIHGVDTDGRFTADLIIAGRVPTAAN